MSLVILSSTYGNALEVWIRKRLVERSNVKFFTFWAPFLNIVDNNMMMTLKQRLVIHSTTIEFNTATNFSSCLHLIRNLHIVPQTNTISSSRKIFIRFESSGWRTRVTVRWSASQWRMSGMRPLKSCPENQLPAVSASTDSALCIARVSTDTCYLSMLCTWSHSEGILVSAGKKGSVIDWMSKFSKKADSYAQGIREHGKFYLLAILWTILE